MSAGQTNEEGEMTRALIPVARFRAPGGSQHIVGVMSVEEGWRIVDQNGAGPEVIDTLTDERDGREQAEAVARDYVEWSKLPSWARQ